MKRILCLMLSAVMAFLTPALTVFAKPVWPVDTGIESEAGIVMDMDSGAVLFGQNIHVKKAPASITKLLTALVVIENSNLTDMVTFSDDAVNNVESGSGNKFSLAAGDQLSVEDCLYALLLQSSNQAANALAEYVAGSRDAFVDMMNKKVESLNCENTNFANPSGLNDDNQYTSAYDMAIIATAAYENATLLQINSSKSHKLPATQNNPSGVTFAMEHKLMTTTDPNSSTYFPYAVAGKTGYTSIAGQTLVTYAQKDNRRLICVTLKSTAVTHYKDSIALLSFGFDRFQNINITQPEPAVANPVTIGDKTYELSDLSVDISGAVTIPKGAAFTDLVKSVKTELPKGHPKGAVALLSYTYDDRVVGQVYVISAKQVIEDGIAPEQAGGTKNTKGEADSLSVSAAADENKAQKQPIQIPVKGIVTAMGILVAGALICGGFFYYKKKKEEEQRMIAERRRKRRQRLEEVGCSEAEFNRLLQKRTGKRSSNSDRPKKRDRDYDES